MHRPLAARADDQQVDLSAEPSELLPGTAVDCFGLDAIEAVELRLATANENLGGLRPVRGKRGFILDVLARDHPPCPFRAPPIDTRCLQAARRDGSSRCELVSLAHGCSPSLFPRRSAFRLDQLVIKGIAHELGA